MRSGILPTIFGLTTAALVAAPVQAADTFSVVSGTTSLQVEPLSISALAGLGLVFDGAFDTVTPASGFDVGFPIVPPGTGAASTSFSFSYDDATKTFSNFAGTIEHTGGLSFAVDTDRVSLLSPFEIGNFSIGFNNGFFLADNFSVGGLVLFDLVPIGAPTLNGNQLTLTASANVSSAFNNVIGNAVGFDPGLTGARIGIAQVSAQAVPEPTTIAGVLTAGGLLLAGRRKVKR